MTNFEYIIKSCTERDIVDIVAYSYTRPSFVKKIYNAWKNWASSFSPNTGNMAKGCTFGKEIIKDNPSIWLCEQWHMPDGTIEKKGRTRSVSMQVWLSLQYNPKDWEENY